MAAVEALRPRGGSGIVGAPSAGASGGIGRRAGLRIPWGNPWRFESSLAHQLSVAGRGGAWQAALCAAGNRRQGVAVAEVSFLPLVSGNTQIHAPVSNANNAASEMPPASP